MIGNRRQANGLAVSLFPFLAVLICTMGALIVMLVLAVRSSAVKAREARQEHAVQLGSQREELLDQLDLEQFRMETLSGLRPQLLERLEQAKLKRSHLDEEIRRLVEQAAELQAEFSQLQDDEVLAEDSRQQEQERLDQLREKIRLRREELRQLRESVTERPVMYSIVPTRAPDGTARRPIYVECSASGITLYPSGIRLGLDDFTRPVLPGNPLDAALLATREYWNKFDAGSAAGEPYPLIVVRPGGATAYAIARRAMTSWDDEFGYELVESTRQLNWGQPDPNLDENVRQAIAIARQRLVQQVATGEARWLTTGLDRMQEVMGGQPLSSGAEGGGGATSPHQLASGDNPLPSSPSANLPAGHAGESGVSVGRVDGSTFSSGSGEGSKQTRIDTSRNDSLSRFALQDTRFVSRDDNPLRSADTGAISGEGNPDVAGTSAGSPVTGAATQSVPLAAERGSDWALPTRTPGATPYRRPIRVDCQPDYYLVYSGEPDRAAVRVPIGESVDQAIDQLVNQIWNQIEGWGLAEIGGFWKPVLRLATQDIQGAARADELARKLQDSGIEIERQWR
jgi:hypothetical protein